MKILNPIISGFHPDPSICRVGKDFYLVCSSFEYFPAIPIFHSTDLLRWKKIGHCLTRNSQVKLRTGCPNCWGIYAPTIRYNNGIFYCIFTNVPEGNFLVWTKDIYGEWSEPIALDFDGIDPSLFFDDDGRVYYSGTDKNIFVCEIDIDKGKAIGQKKYVWKGTGANNPEGPHLYKIGDFYYLLIAEGGTELGHMVTIARSKAVFGEYESCPYNPVLTNRGTELPIKAVGHSDLFNDANGRWWAVCLGNRPITYPFKHTLGRETMLVPVEWENGWPVMGDGHVHEEINLNFSAGESGQDTDGYYAGDDVDDEFSGEKLHLSWNYIYNQDQKFVRLTKEGLMLTANGVSLSDDKPKGILCRRQEHFDFFAETKLLFSDFQNGEEAGISVYLNNKHHYDIALTKINNKKCIVFKRQIGSLKAMENIIEYDSDTAVFGVRGTKDSYVFYYKKGEKYISAGSGEAAYLTTEAGGCFTGNFIAIFTSAEKKGGKSSALFKRFIYRKVK
jgi:alpha-N-arabinofuranosidase